MYSMMKELLVHDLSEDKFADMYAQTLVYGLFVARYNDPNPDTFSRGEARDLVPKSNPFLQKFFDHIVGPDFDNRLSYIVDELCEVFRVSDVSLLVQKHLRLIEDTNDKDPIIHFYEDFLKEYDPVERKKMGAYYTPTPVVQFIVRQVDQLLKDEFGITDGLADSTKRTIEVEVGQQLDTMKTTASGRRVKTKTTKRTEEVHRVQILDPAVGTATFLNKTIKHIHKSFQGQEGRWPSYVEHDLLPRLHGFELMMAPYTIAHLKLGMTLQELGLDDFSERLGVYLTNTLEEGIPSKQDLFNMFGLAQAVTEESQKASEIKNERPIMVVICNPPYSGVSSNETEYANSLVQKYKTEPGGQQKLQERKHWLNDDYVKFISFAEDMISKNGEGVVAMITNNGYLDNPTFRGMRWHLAKTFNKIYVLDLHGNAKKKEISPDGSKDQNVFNIQQGVSIVLAVKSASEKSNIAKVYHADLFGTRADKFAALGERSIKWRELSLYNNNYYFVPRNIEGQSDYEKGVKLDELFRKSVSGIVTMDDKFIVHEDKSVIAERVQKLANGEYTQEYLNKEFGLGKNYAKFVLGNAHELTFDESKLVKIAYRPFDERWTYFDNKVLWRWRGDIMKSQAFSENISLATIRTSKDLVHSGYLLSGYAADARLADRFMTYLSPLYIYNNNNDNSRSINFDIGTLKMFVIGLKKAVVVDDDQKAVSSDMYQPEDVLDYIYAVLHSPTYRERYKEFLKIDFPRVPAPKNDEEFMSLGKYGKRLRQLHLMDAGAVGKYDTTYPESGSDEVEKVSYQDEKVYINDSQYFGNVPETAWSFYIGGYQPAQKWLKDRKGRKLNNNDIDHYQKIIKILLETDKTMQEIDKAWKPD